MRPRSRSSPLNEVGNDMRLFDKLRRLVGRRPAPEPRHAVRLSSVPLSETPPERTPLRPIAQAIAELEPYEEPSGELPDAEVLAQLKLPSLPTFALRAANLSREIDT